MGATPVADIPNGTVDTLSSGAGEVDFRSFEIASLASDANATPTGMREEIVLLSWLIVLLRTREGGHISFDWTYKTGFQHETATVCLSMEKVMTGLQDPAGKVAAAILDGIKTTQQATASAPVSLLLSTSSLSQTPEEAKDEGVLHLEVRFSDGQLEARPVWQTANMLPFTVSRHADVLADTIKVCLANPGASIEECLRPTPRDLDDIWSWNHELPPTYDMCMHDLISERAQTQPDKVGIDSWDGTLTYAQIDQYSTIIAHQLRDAGVALNDVVPACFEKSRWTIVAVLAIMKSGATFALMDPTLPLARLQNMATQVGAKTMLTSRAQLEFATSILPSGTHLVVDEPAFANPPAAALPATLPPVPTTTLMYIIFTSGSTGTPKGVTISHRAYTSSAFPRAAAVGYIESSRVLDFASYAFDVSIDSMLLTIHNGGTLCIPSDADRLNDINGVIRAFRVNYTGVTPSVARILEPDVISSLHGLGLGGEASSARDVALWGRDTRIIIGYGPCECTIGCTINSDTATGRDYISIGTGNGAAIWIVDPADHERLVPVGAVGELLVEGPIVGQGYLNDAAKTAEVFIADPGWLVAGHGGYAGRSGRLYKTGDLGRFDPDGSGGIVFAGRKDTQVKLRGQRVELGEIESQLRARLPGDVNVIAEVVVPQGAGAQPTLVAFVAAQGYKDGELSRIELGEELRGQLANADKELAKVVPRYMVPTAYIPVNHVPVLISGKTDRKRLRAFGQTVDLRSLDQGAATRGARELSELEERLRRAWGQVLKVDAEGIRPDDNLFALGGDSLAAMKLVSVCRADGLDLSVISTFENPTLEAMAGVVQVMDSQDQTEIAPFSMISQDTESARIEAALACGVDPSAIEDIYPSTPTQQNLFTFALKSTKAYIAQRVARIPDDIDLDAWKAAWGEVVAATPILRSRLAQLQEPGLQQVVLAESIPWHHATSLADYLSTDATTPMDLGQPLARYAIITTPDSRHMVWTIHHVLYDGWSEPLVLDHLRLALQGHPLPPSPQMRDFVSYLRTTSPDLTTSYWRTALSSAIGPQFPPLPSRDYLPHPTATLTRSIPLPPHNLPFTLATLIRAAWALVAAHHTSSPDILFGETLSGRDTPGLASAPAIVGPLIATVPVRIRVPHSATVSDYLAAVQRQTVERAPHQHLGFQHIRRVSADAQRACETGTGLVIQPEGEAGYGDLGFEAGDAVREALRFNAYPVMLACGIGGADGGFRVCASFDKGVVGVGTMRRVLGQLEAACVGLLAGVGEGRRVGEVSCLPEAEVEEVWRWNRLAPMGVVEGRVRAGEGVRAGETYPRAVVPWVCDARNPGLLAPIGCVGELWLEGECLLGEGVEDPAWLVKGSVGCVGRRGTVYPTGDMVRLLEDGSLVFVRRKDKALTIQGHAVDVGDFDAHFSRHLPPSARVAVAVSQVPSESEEDVLEQKLLVFVEAAEEEDRVEIMSAEHGVIHNDKSLQLRSSIPVSLAVALKKLDKFIQETLASYMIPFAYVVVDRIPTDKDLIDHATLNQLASLIPHDVLVQIRQGINEAWIKTAPQSVLTPAEEVLRSAWAALLGLAPEQIDVDDNFFRLGGDSVSAMKLVSRLRSQGHSLSVADIFLHMRLQDAANVMKMNHASPAKKTPTYKPFSLLGKVDVDAFLADTVRPQLADPSWTIHDVYPVTDMQALDVHDTIHPPRTSVQYTLLYFDTPIDPSLLSRACTQLVAAHDILRTVFIRHGPEPTTLQVVLSNLSIPLTTSTAPTPDLASHIKSLCATDIASPFPLGSPFLSLHHLLSPTTPSSCLILRLSHAQYDGVSLPRLLSDLSALFASKPLPPSLPLSTYLALPPPSPFPQFHPPTPHPFPSSTTSPALFLSAPLPPQTTSSLYTPSTLLTASWALLLARRLRTPTITIGAIASARLLDTLDADTLVAPTYAIVPLHIPFARDWSAAELLAHVQRAVASTTPHAYVGAGRIAEAGGFAGASEVERYTGGLQSIVHHQDADEDFDEMAWGEGGVARVDVEKPDGDSAVPVKVVSFVKGGVTWVGVVGREGWREEIEEVVEELVGVWGELVEGGEEGGKAVLDGDLFE